MPETFDHATTNPGSGGTNLAGDTFPQGGVTHFLPACYLVFGPADGPYTRVDTGAGLPVSVQNASLAVTGPLTDAQLRATPVPVSGTVAVTGTFWQATQPVSGPLTDAQLRAAAVPVSGTFWQATQPVSIAATLGVDTELPAAAALADNASTPTAPAVGAFGMLWDGVSGWDREPANQEASLLASAARTSTTSSAAQTNRGHRGVIVWLNVTGAGAGGTILVHIQGWDPAASAWVTLNATPAGAGAGFTGGLGMEVSPGASGGTAATAGYMIQRVGGGLPRTWRVSVVHDTGNSFTYSVSFSLLR